MSFDNNVTGMRDSDFQFQCALSDDENEKSNVPLIVLASKAHVNAYHSSALIDVTNEQFDSQSTLSVSSTVANNSEGDILLHSDNLIFSSSINTSVQGVADDSVNKKHSNYVYQILNCTYEGNFQLASYDFELIEENKLKLLENKKTTYFSKNKIAKLVVNHEFHRTNSLHISSDRFVELAKLTSEVFPTLLPESFYSKRTSTKSACGAFQYYYGKQREKEIAIRRLQGPTKRKAEEQELILGDLKILQERVNIIDDKYLNLWSETASSEKQELYSKNDLEVILEKLPNLSHPLGYLLIETDFRSTYNKDSNLFMQNFNAIVPKLIALAKSKRDAETKEIISANSTYTTEEHQRTVALILLPYLFKRTAKITARSKGKTSWTPHHHEVLKSFIVHLKTTENLQEALKVEQDKLLQLYNDHQLIVRPYVIICGATLSDIHAAFVVAGPMTYQLSSASVAIDICFKLHKVFHEPYSSICNHIWQFFEKKIYGFEVTNLFLTVTYKNLIHVFL